MFFRSSGRYLYKLMPTKVPFFPFIYVCASGFMLCIILMFKFILIVTHSKIVSYEEFCLAAILCSWVVGDESHQCTASKDTGERGRTAFAATPSPGGLAGYGRSTPQL